MPFADLPLFIHALLLHGLIGGLDVFLFMSLGALVVLVGQLVYGWSALPTAVARTGYGWASRVLSVMAAGALVWAVRDGGSAPSRITATD